MPSTIAVGKPLLGFSRQFGKIPEEPKAVLASGWVDIQFFASDVPEDFDFLHPRPKNIPTHPLPTTSAAQGTEFMQPTRTLSADEMQTIIDGKGKAVIWGHMEYRDVFPDTDVHHVHYCLKVFPANVGAIVSFPLHRPECNYSD
jgi:hypothetical protein